MTTYAAYKARVRENWAAVRDQCADQPRPSVLPPAKLHNVMQAVLDITGVGIDEIVGKGHHPFVTFARGFFGRAAYTFVDTSWPEIGRYVGRTTHSSTLTQAKVFDGREDRDVLLEKVRRILVNAGLRTFAPTPAVSRPMAAKFLQAMSEGSH